MKIRNTMMFYYDIIKVLGRLMKIKNVNFENKIVQLLSNFKYSHYKPLISHY